MKFLFTDDKTKSFSDTTLRTWLLFFLFFFTALAMIVIELISPGSVSERAIVLLDVAAVAAGGGGALYLGKRWNERTASDDWLKSQTPAGQEFDPTSRRHRSAP